MTAPVLSPDELEILVGRQLRTKHPYELTKDIEAEARYKTWMAYMKRNRGRLFEIGPHAGREKRHWDAMAEMWYGKAIGCVPVMGGDWIPESFDMAVLVGVFLGVQTGYFGSADFVVGHFSGPGSATHRSPLNIEFVHVLGGPYQKIIDARYFRDDDEDWFDADD